MNRPSRPEEIVAVVAGWAWLHGKNHVQHLINAKVGNIFIVDPAVIHQNYSNKAVLMLCISDEHYEIFYKEKASLSISSSIHLQMLSIYQIWLRFLNMDKLMLFVQKACSQ